MTLENNHAREPHNFYPEPPSASHALFRSGLIPQGALIYDPACGCGSVLRMAAVNRFAVVQGDVRRGQDFMLVEPRDVAFDERSFTVVTNPPYGKHASGRRIEEAFIEHALRLGASEVYALLPLPWLAARVDWLKETGCVAAYVLRPRLSVLSYSAMKAGQWPGGGGKDYAWYRFQNGVKRSFIVDELHRNVELDTRENWTWWNE